MKKTKFILTCLSGICLFFSSYALGATSEASNKATSTSKYSLSFDQIKMAAENGDADAQYALGYMFYYGKGGASKDGNLAKMWIGKAAAQKQPQAVKAIALLNGKKSTQEESKPIVNAKEENHTIVPTTKEIAESKALLAQARADTHDVVERSPVTNKESTVDMRHASASHEVSVPKGYTLQLLGASNKDRIELLIKQHHLNQAKIYRTSFKQKDWYVLINGQYKTKSEAQAAAKKFETELSLKPWVKVSESMKECISSS